MKRRTVLILKILALISILINLFIPVVFIYIGTMDLNIIIFGLILAIAISFLGLIRIQWDKTINDFSVGSIITMWIGDLIVTVVIFKYLVSTNVIGSIVLIISVVLEMLSGLIIMCKDRVHSCLKKK